MGAFSTVGSRLLLDRPEVVNSPTSDEAMEQKQHYVFEGITRMIALTPDLNEFAAYWAQEREFWTRRNETMVKNIMKHLASREARRVAVLCGFEHRNYLRRALTKHAIPGTFVLREYWAMNNPEAK